MIYQPFDSALLERGHIMAELRDAYRWQYFIWDNYREFSARLIRLHSDPPDQHWHTAAVAAARHIRAARRRLTDLGMPVCRHHFVPNWRGDYICIHCDRFSPWATATRQSHADYPRSEP